MFCLALRLGFKRFREEFEEKEWRPSCTLTISLGLMEGTANTVRSLPFPDES